MKLSKFKNESYTDWSKPKNRTRQEADIRKVISELGKEYPNIIGGEKVFTDRKLKSLNPSNPDEIVGVFQQGTTADAERAMEVAWKAFDTWKTVPAERRAAVLLKASAIMKKERFRLNAIEMVEVGKTWPEADADVAEAIDFCEFYAREMLRLANVNLPTQMPGEKDELVYLPLGVGIVIPPWNFPLAILAGMTVAAVVTGNTVILKPSSDSPLIGYTFVDILRRAGLPAGVVNFLAGPGAEVGDTLVRHPKTRFVAFTGSKEVGIRINEEAAKVQPGQLWLKRVIAEMGGKDAIIVDHETNLDDAVAGIAVSAFGFQGQKCSACSRAIVDAKVYDTFVDLLQKRVETMSVGQATSMSNYMGPVINRRSMEKTLEAIATGIREGGRLVTGGGPARPSEKGYFLQPTVIADVDPASTIAQQEIFAPVLAVLRAENFDHALEIANNTEFGLTGAVYSKNKKKLARAKEQFFCGNLYLNRKCTGAMVGAHPFGGFNMSGTDSKAGGHDYLLLFLQAKSIATKLK